MKYLLYFNWPVIIQFFFSVLQFLKTLANNVLKDAASCPLGSLQTPRSCGKRRGQVTLQPCTRYSGFTGLVLGPSNLCHFRGSSCCIWCCSWWPIGSKKSSKLRPTQLPGVDDRCPPPYLSSCHLLSLKCREEAILWLWWRRASNIQGWKYLIRMLEDLV